MLIRNEGEDQMLTKEGEGNPPRTQPLQKYRFLIAVMSIALLVAALGAGVKLQQVHGAHADSVTDPTTSAAAQCPSVSLAVYPANGYPGSYNIQILGPNADIGQGATGSGTVFGADNTNQTWTSSTASMGTVSLTTGTTYTFAGYVNVYMSDPVTGNETSCSVSINQSVTAS